MTVQASEAITERVFSKGFAGTSWYGTSLAGTPSARVPPEWTSLPLDLPYLSVNLSITVSAPPRTPHPRPARSDHGPVGTPSTRALFSSCPLALPCFGPRCGQDRPFCRSHQSFARRFFLRHFRALASRHAHWSDAENASCGY